MSTPEPPANLSAAGLALWSSIVPTYELRADEVRLLHDACRQADIVQRLEDELADSPLIVKGSQGQLVASPLVSEVRQHRTVLAALLKALKLPDTPAGTKQKSARTSEQARAAARARWGKRDAG
ncbi:MULTISPECIES: hypothetical protein [Nocardiopsidaceae]|uniref:Terminase n=2 Tax=Nocardiopsidaceae TaxID=83676 RepID=A0A368T6H9_9ACTN|nr:hypothetical protein [Marinitenerispora sediminis]RCV53479.1 hypothetical protein DEF23_17525 [Marinitenerispora sediminis]RCV59307.1 hypothetical protein DEF24_10065 [Marinitenerispora sediminis]